MDRCPGYEMGPWTARVRSMGMRSGWWDLVIVDGLKDRVG
ncbi:hypothetical protein AVEN_94188-1, partial [Araneus ventricosus]